MSFETSDMDLGEPTHSLLDLPASKERVHGLFRPSPQYYLSLSWRLGLQHVVISQTQLGHVDLGEPTHTFVVSCWMPKPLPPRNECTGCFIPASDMCISYISELLDVWINDIVTLILAWSGNSNKQSQEARPNISQRHKLCTHNPTYTLDYVLNYSDSKVSKEKRERSHRESRREWRVGAYKPKNSRLISSNLCRLYKL